MPQTPILTVAANPEKSIYPSPISDCLHHQKLDEEIYSGIKITDSAQVERLVQRKRNKTKGILCVFGAFMGLFSTFGQINAFGTFQEWYSENQLSDRSSSEISWIGSSQLCAFFLSGWVIGRLFDAYGPRMLVLAGAVLSTFSLILASISVTFAEFVVTQGVLFGLGSALVFYPSIASVSTHYSKYKATAIGIALAGTSIGGIVFPIISHKLLAIIGFKKTLQVLGIISLVTCLIATVSVTSNNDHERSRNAPWVDVRNIFDEKFVVMISGCVIVAFGLFIPYIFIVEYTTASHLTSVSFYILSAMNGGATLGRIGPAIVSDVYGRFNLLVTVTTLAGTSCLALWLPAAVTAAAIAATNGAALIIAFAVIYGLFSGAFISLINPCVFQMSERGQEGTRMGALNSLVAVPTLLGGPIGGVLLASGHGTGFRYMAAFSGSCLILGSILLAVIRHRLGEGRILVKV